MSTRILQFKLAQKCLLRLSEVYKGALISGSLRGALNFLSKVANYRGIRMPSALNWHSLDHPQYIFATSRPQLTPTIAHSR